MKNRLIIAIVISILALSFLSACGNKEEASAPAPTQSSVSADTNSKVEVDLLVYNQGGLKVYIQTIEKNSYDYCFRFKVENKSKNDVTSSICTETYFDDFGIVASHGASSEPPSGKTGFIELSYFYNYFSDMGLDYQSAKIVEGILDLTIDNDYSNQLHVPFNVDLRDYFKQADSPIEPVPFTGKALYDKDGLRIYIQSIKKTELDYNLLLRIENDTGHQISSFLCADTFIDDHGVSLAHGASVEPAPGKVGNISLSLFKSEVEKADLKYDKLKTLEGNLTLWFDNNSSKTTIPFKINFKDYKIIEK